MLLMLLICEVKLTAVYGRYGRRATFLMTSVAGGVLGVTRAFMPTYVSYVLFEFLEPTFGSGVYSTGFILGE